MSSGNFIFGIPKTIESHTKSLDEAARAKHTKARESCRKEELWTKTVVKMTPDKKPMT
jgi:hypothetical protein